MANRSYLYSLERSDDGKNASIKGLSESEYNIPFIYRVFVSVNPKATKSIIWKGEEMIAITADYAGGVARLVDFLERFPKKRGDKTAVTKLLKFLYDKNNVRKYIHLECGEIFDLEDEEPEIQNAKLICELANIDTEIEEEIKCIATGDRSSLKELAEEYWNNTLYFSPNAND